MAGAPARRRIGPSSVRIAAARSGGSLTRTSRRTHARWPSSFGGGSLRLAFDEREDGGRIDQHQRAQGPGQGLLDVRLGVADERRR